MDAYNIILSKSEINARAVNALLAIISNGLVATKTDLAECLGAKPSKFSEILNFRMSVGVDMIAKICDYYSVDPEWVLLGRGSKIFRPDYVLKPHFIDDGNSWLDRRYHSEDKAPQNNEKEPTNEDNQAAALLLKMLAEKETTILDQAKHIGRLEAQIDELKKRLEKTADGANTGATANVG